ncbi:YagK/YfjJ domain-containing protein [Paludibacterium denitrificans]|uniref:Inovirus Gp2 family protein n=1 Tax=Paludibacterium denitrificans TaxID=2675226 RepID=A0A844GFP9_9NEIS|nr:inovirus Gp2 family protein [Paludibacterium denitrificans]
MFYTNATYPLQRGDQQSIEALFYRASYLCKSATKEYGNGLHGFGVSRR